MAKATRAFVRQNDCLVHHAVLIAPVSGARLQKMGIFQVFAGDFCFLSEVAYFLEDWRHRWLNNAQYTGLSSIFNNGISG
jgi:hypothetical protein